MSHRFVASLGLVLTLALSGCHHGNTALLERELRLHEDEIFELQDQLNACQAMNASGRRENEALKAQLAGGGEVVPSSDQFSPTMPAGPTSRPAERTRPSRRPTPLRKQRAQEPQMPSDLDPVIEPGIPIGPGDDTSSATEGAALRGALASLRAPKKPPADQRVAAIAINKQLTGGRRHYGHGGDDGVMIVFAARNAAAEAVNVPGDISLSVMDPAERGAASYVANWNFSSDESTKAYRATALSEGFHFELPWPSTPPKHKALRVFVRYVTTDGRKLVAQQDINIAPPDREAKKSWTPAPPNTAAASPKSEPVTPSERRGMSKTPVAERPTWRPFR